MTSNQPHPTQPSTDEQPEQKVQSDRPSALQITASALAAMTTTALMSTLGAAGTIIGAALASVVTVFANFVYTTSIRRTKDKVTTVVPYRSRPRPGGAAGPVTEVGPTGSSAPPTADGAPGTTPVGSHPAPNAAASWTQRLRSAVRTVVDRWGWRRILAVVAGVFVLVLAAVTVIELVAGKPLTNVVRNEEGVGTSVFGRTTDAPAIPDEVEVPAPSPSDIPSPEPTAPTVPEDSPSEAPTSEVPTEQPTAPTPEPTQEPTAPPSPNPPAPGGSPEQPPAQPDASADQAAESGPAPVG